MLGRLWIQIAAEEGGREGGTEGEGRGVAERDEWRGAGRRMGAASLPGADVATSKFLHPEPPQNETLFRHQKQVVPLGTMVTIAKKGTLFEVIYCDPERLTSRTGTIFFFFFLLQTKCFVFLSS